MPFNFAISYAHIIPFTSWYPTSPHWSAGAAPQYWQIGLSRARTVTLSSPLNLYYVAAFFPRPISVSMAHGPPCWHKIKGWGVFDNVNYSAFRFRVIYTVVACLLSATPSIFFCLFVSAFVRFFIFCLLRRTKPNWVIAVDMAALVPFLLMQVTMIKPSNFPSCLQQ